MAQIFLLFTVFCYLSSCPIAVNESEALPLHRKQLCAIFNNLATGDCVIELTNEMGCGDGFALNW